MRTVVNLFKKFLNKKPSKSKRNQTPTIIPRNEHPITRSKISQSALKVLYRLHKAGYSAFLVGGSVRDLLLGSSPKDFDIATDALPEQIQRLFSNSFIIGRRFRLVHVRFGREIIEVATFRGNTQNATGRITSEEGLLLRDNVYGTLEDDVWRRDFTINALYYNIADFTVVDYTGGMRDLQDNCLRVIGNPIERYTEDPVRMLRAIRLAGKLDFKLEPKTATAIQECKNLLQHIPPARLFDKMLKIFHSGKSYDIFLLMQEHNIFAILFPQVAETLKESSHIEFLHLALKNTDQRIREGKSINSAFIFAVLLWPPLLQRKIYLEEKETLSKHQALHLAMADILADQNKLVSIPKKFLITLREIWHLQYHLENARAKRLLKVLHHPRFRAAFDFLQFRAETQELSLQPISTWWADFQEANEEDREKLITSRFKKVKSQRRRKKRGNDDQGISSTG